jgi:hypothetical protein
MDSSFGIDWDGSLSPTWNETRLYGTAAGDGLTDPLFSIPQYYRAYLTKFHEQLTSGVFVLEKGV